MNLWGVALLVLILDQLTKWYVGTHFYPGESVPVVEGVFHWTYILNTGAAFGILEGSRWLFMVIALASAAALWYLRDSIRAEGRLFQLGTALFGGGAIGNLIDRALRGAVTDFFDFRIWPVFNLADMAICAGVGLIIWKMLETDLRANGKA